MYTMKYEGKDMETLNFGKKLKVKRRISARCKTTDDTHTA